MFISQTRKKFTLSASPVKDGLSKSLLTLFLSPKMKPLTTGLARSRTTQAFITTGGAALEAKAS